MIWPFTRARAKPKTSQPSQPPGCQTENPSSAAAPAASNSAGGAAVVTPTRPRRRQSRRLQKVPSPPRMRKGAASPKEKEDIRTAALAPPLDPTALTSSMDIDFAGAGRPRAATDGSTEDEKNITALPGSRTLRTSPHLRPVAQDAADIPYSWHLRTASHQSLPTNHIPPRRGKLQRNPSHNKRAAQYESPLARRRSSKKRKNDPLREEEIRAMSAAVDVPKRAGDTGLLRRESRKSRGALNRHFERPTSTVSLPFEESLHSSLSGEAEQRNYRLSVLDVMSPRPAIRIRNLSKTYSQDAATSKLLRNTSRSDRPSGKPVQMWRPTQEEQKTKERARIDSLADDMDSTELRDILERDQKRKERRRERDTERLKRKLERRAEKQRTKEWLAQQQTEEDKLTGAQTQLSSNALGIASATAQEKHKDTRVEEETDFPMEDVDSPQDPFADPLKEKERERADQQGPKSKTVPMEDIHPAFRHQYQAAQAVSSPAARPEEEPRMDVLATPMSDVQTPMETPAVATAQAVSYTAARPISPLSPVTSSIYHGDRVKASKILGTDVAGGSYTVSNTVVDDASLPKEAAPVKPLLVTRLDEPTSKEPESSLSASKKRGGFLASLFRASRRSVSEAPRQAPPIETSFSNTSREETSRTLPSHLVHEPSSATSYKKSSMPLRTHSIFREDLPESPLSRSTSRVQSPVEGSVPGRGVSARRAHVPSAIFSEGSSRIDSPDSDGPKTPTSPAKAALMSQSLASVDSEASWLSGKSPRSTSRAQKHSSLGGGSLGRRDDFQGSFEELGVPDDEYFKRLNTPLRSGELQTSNLSVAIADSQHASSTALRSPGLTPDVDAGVGSSNAVATKEGQVSSHAGASRQPTVVLHNSRHKSSEGLLNSYLSASRPATAGAVSEDNEKTPKAEYPTPAETPTEERSSEEMTPVQRATSVKLGKGHARNMSAGSAKLLDITRRGSASLSTTPNPPATPQRSQFSLGKEGSSPLEEKDAP